MRRNAIQFSHLQPVARNNGREHLTKQGGVLVTSWERYLGYHILQRFWSKDRVPVVRIFIQKLHHCERRILIKMFVSPTDITRPNESLPTVELELQNPRLSMFSLSKCIHFSQSTGRIMIGVRSVSKKDTLDGLSLGRKVVGSFVLADAGRTSKIV